MSQPVHTVVGIDVGGERKGFHAVALRGEIFVDKTTNTNAAKIVDWCLGHKAIIVAVDAPCKWSKDGSSRLAERELMKRGIWCFSSPTRQKALLHDFYKWVLNGEKLYRLLVKNYPLFEGKDRKGLACIETFPHAIVCAIEGKVVPAKPKLKVRRDIMQNRGYDISELSSIDYVDAALCAVTAEEFRKGNYQKFGDCEEGFIVVPA
ncbi:MAG: DUF429 domain-containing protein [Dehalococcoidales bacterium]|nr:DUF429 domain-containing protein [Dehalococcoidales bacterium]